MDHLPLPRAAAQPSTRPPVRRPPTTRYQGSKRKLLDWLWSELRRIDFTTALDPFSGTASVAYRLKAEGKSVVCNDYLRSNQRTAEALVVNHGGQVSWALLDSIGRRKPGKAYHDVVQRNFEGVFFTDDENGWLDAACQNLAEIEDQTAQAVGYYALFQACLVKRPYNLFHRKNLNLRIADVPRSFGNKATWDRPFDAHFAAFVAEARRAAFSGPECRALCGEALEAPTGFDLVYLDPPYVPRKGTAVDYWDFYHFLEGMADYTNWEPRIDRRRKHLPLLGPTSVWSDRRTNLPALTRMFERHERSALAVSYRDDGSPTIDELAALLRRFKPNVRVSSFGRYQYALSTNRRSREVLLVGV